jgi:tetratricopeptide (TPR) repeat protein
VPTRLRGPGDRRSALATADRPPGRYRRTSERRGRPPGAGTVAPSDRSVAGAGAASPPDPSPLAAPAPAPARTDPAALARAAAADDLALANQLRAGRRWKDAAQAYARVAARAPDTEEAYVAELALAGLLLQPLARPADALTIYRRARSETRWGPLRQEALYGEAACYQALGDRAAERTALQAFLTEFPATPLRAAVEHRLTELR